MPQRSRLLGSTLAERLALNVRRDGACLRWTGSHNHKGYGQISVAGAGRSVHRVAYELHVGPIPPGLEIDHVRARGCRFRDCIEPSHLEPVTHIENIRRTPKRTHCPKGHELTPANVVMTSQGRRCRTCKRAEHMTYMARRRRGAAPGAHLDDRRYWGHKPMRHAPGDWRCTCGVRLHGGEHGTGRAGARHAMQAHRSNLVAKEMSHD